MVWIASGAGWVLRWGAPCRTVVLLTALVVSSTARLPAAEADSSSNVPLVVINVASVERLMNQALAAFEAAGRPELAETLGDVLERVNDLKGFDRNEAIGVMVYLNGLLPEVVAYVPIKDLDEVLQTVEIGPITTKKTADDRFEIVGRRQTFYGRVLADYAFLASAAAPLDRDFRDPAALTARLSRDYDVAVSLNLKSVAAPTREVFLGMVRANSESDLQRRDNEPEEAHRLRRAAGMQNIELIEALLVQGEALTIGWRISGADRTANLELVALASPNSELAGYFNELKGSRSRFAGLLASNQPLTASLAWTLNRSAKGMFHEMIAVVETRLVKCLGPADDGPSADARIGSAPDPVSQLVKALRGTIDAGRLDLALQFVGQPEGTFVLVGGLKVAHAVTLSDGLVGILARLKDNEALADVQLNAFRHEGVSLHRLEFQRTRRQDERLYGGRPGLYLGVGDGVLWLAVGGDAAPGELKRLIDKGGEPVAKGAAHLPLQVVVNFARWMDLIDPERKADGLAAIARRSFAQGGDALRIEAHPIDDGLRINVTMDEAFLRMAGQFFAKQIDARQAREAKE